MYTNFILGSGTFENETKPPSYMYSNRDDTSPSDSSWTLPSPLGHNEENPKQTDKFTSYEELRRRNRNQWMNTGKQKPFSSTPPQVIHTFV